MFKSERSNPSLVIYFHKRSWNQENFNNFDIKNKSTDSFVLIYLDR